ncbi:DUF6160 family protein [Acinetobacter sp. ANC 4648]|uniref:DUF6160 family protein n=1 Tax=Acinetobacter sp. ANC 4648 TaxID=1977875 RepID=UPI000A33A7DC|nr:DUF6160 family protein [Acinetobacter sp. ANC 4648]OTG83832.1 heme utilization protein [Acinetobacter sp. ANC 4648]
MINRKQNHGKGFILNTLTLSMFFMSGSTYALQALNDSDLRSVNGQDGVHISTTFKEANIDTLYWTDNAGRGTQGAIDSRLTTTADTVKIQKSNALSVPLGADYKINLGSEGNKTGLDFDLAVAPLLLTIDSFRICDVSAYCSEKIGNIAVQTTSDLNIGLKTRDGLFSKNSQAELLLGVKNANIYLGQTNINNQLNQLIFKNFNFNFKGKGYVFIDEVAGLKLQTNNSIDASLSQAPNEQYGYVDFTRVADSASNKIGFKNTGTYGNGSETTNAGLNLEIMLNKGVNATTPYALDANTNSPAGAMGLIRVGASGRMVNGYLQLRGLDSTGSTDLLGKADSPSGTTNNNIMGSSGIAFRMKADFTKDGDTMLGSDGKATTLEIGGAGLNTYGFEFGNLTGLQPGTRGTFDSGNIYINLIDTKNLQLPENYTFQNSRFGNNSYLTTLDDYKQNVHLLSTNPYAVAMSIRGGEFQAISRRGRFTTSAGVIDPANLFVSNGLNNEWGLALPFYNLNANIAMYGTKVTANTAYYYTDKGVKSQVATSGNTARLGFSMAMSTEGIDKDLSRDLNSIDPNDKLSRKYKDTVGYNKGTKTTSILVIDGGDRDGISANGIQSTDYYMGLRNVDLLMKGTGNIGVENGSLNLSLKNMLIVMAAEVAAGYLPGTTYKSCALGIASAAAACAIKDKSSSDNFALKDDVVWGVKLRLGGDMDLSLIPNSEIKADGSGSRLSIVGDMTLADVGNTIQINDPVNGSSIGLDNLTGKIGFNNAIVMGKDQENGLGKVGFNAALIFNPDQNPAGVFRARDLNLYPPKTGAGARLGELAITGGRLTSEFNITPR